MNCDTFSANLILKPVLGVKGLGVTSKNMWISITWILICRNMSLMKDRVRKRHNLKLRIQYVPTEDLKIEKSLKNKTKAKKSILT